MSTSIMSFVRVGLAAVAVVAALAIGGAAAASHHTTVTAEGQCQHAFPTCKPN
ncbi:hypothetical protein Lfu02_31070 [Longispora fulva]|uniref:Uncharacterized protein n=1 Tax=Longispora fulva TaxID=619741 RepID=A0A8J7GJF5_9ACTN|nr:hypothetical protein [Longispora fulva]MBG6139241.1 hypothetical protein [Longispora fulva]GIG58735.1 hypothetical protein Lfu02_31070 [Longispora fulva]